MTRWLVLAALALVLVYGLIEAYPLVSGPSLRVASPADGQTVPGGIVAISGTALRAATLTLDGAPLLADATGGHFATTLAFPAGASILTFMARDRFGRSAMITRTIYVPASSTQATN